MDRRFAAVRRISIWSCALVISIPAETPVWDSVLAASAAVNESMHALMGTSSLQSTNHGSANRGIAMNKPAAIDLCRACVEARVQYFRSDPKAEGLLAFAENILSTAGQRDGLYGPNGEGVAKSPPPSCGYYTTTLLAPGPAALARARDYLLNRRLLVGSALVAWRAEYGVSGCRSLVANDVSDAHARDSCRDTSLFANGLTAFDPDR